MPPRARPHPLPRALLFALLAPLGACTAFVRVAAGPSIDTEGNAGGVLLVSYGLAAGSSGSGSSLANHAVTVAFDDETEAPRVDHRVGVVAFGGPDDSRWGGGGTFALLLPTAPDAYGGKVGLAVGGGLRFRLAGTDPGLMNIGPCLSNAGDRWGLVLTGDVELAWLRGDDTRRTRVSFPVGLEVRINLVPE